jgi:hypothetical protein
VSSAKGLSTQLTVISTDDFIWNKNLKNIFDKPHWKIKNRHTNIVWIKTRMWYNFRIWLFHHPIIW